MSRLIPAAVAMLDQITAEITDETAMAELLEERGHPALACKFWNEIDKLKACARSLHELHEADD